MLDREKYKHGDFEVLTPPIERKYIGVLVIAGAYLKLDEDSRTCGKHKKIESL